MTPTTHIRTFAADEWAIYKDLRLAALAESPDAYGSTLAKEAGRSDTEWSNRLASGVTSSRDFPAVAEIGGRPVGLAWGRIEESDPDVASLYQVWVKPDYRRLGVGQMLLEAVITWATDKRAHYLDLGVTCGGTPAMQLYARAGFEPVGRPQPLRPGAELLSQPMRLELRSGAV